MEPTSQRNLDESRAGGLFAEAAVTLALVLLAWLALDDITTDNSTGFKPEYRLLTVCGGWCLFVGTDLVRKGHRLLGAVSLVAVALAVWVASDGLGHKRDGGWSMFWPEYAVMLWAWLWFLFLGIRLIFLGRGRPGRTRRPGTG